MNILYLYAYIWVTIFVCLSAGPVPQRHRRISYGLKLQNKPRRNAIKTTPITTTTTTTTTTEALKAQNTSFQSIDDYLNYDYDYLHYFYDLDYEDVTAVEVKNKQRNEKIPSESLSLKEEVPSEPLNFNGEIPSEPLSFKKEIPIEPLSFKGEIPSEPLKFKGEIPSESLSHKEEIPIEPLSFKGEIPSEPVSFKGEIPNESLSFKKEIPIEPLSFKEEIPSESLSHKEEISSEQLSFKGQIPIEPLSFKWEIPSESLSHKEEIPSEQLSFKGKIPSEPLSIKGEIQSEPLSFTGEIPSEPPSFKEEFSSLVEKVKGEIIFASEPRIIKEEILSEATKLKSSSSIDILKEIKTSRRNVTKNVRALSGKSESERKTFHEEAIPASQERYSALDEIKSLPVDGTPFSEEDPLTARQNDLLENKKKGSEEKKNLREGDQAESSPERKKKLHEENKILLAESDVLLPLKSGISNEKILKRKAIKIEKDDKSINKINIIVRKPIISNVETKKTELNDSKILSNSTVNGREGRFLDHDSALQKIERLPSIESESSNLNETGLEAASNGIKQLRYTTQQPDMIKSVPKESLNRVFEKQTNSSDQSPKDIGKVVSDKTVSADVPIAGQNFMNNNSKLGWRSESSVSVEVSVESSRARGKEISSTPFHKIIVNSPERAQESMQLKEQLSLEVSATPKTTDILPTVKPGIIKAKRSKRPLITLEPTTESEIITMKPVMATSTTENTITTPEDKTTNTLTSAFPANLDYFTSISPALVISQFGSDSSIHKISSNKRASSDSIDPTHASSFPLTTTSKYASTPPPILLTSDTLKNENKTMKHSIHDQIDTTASMAVTQATMASETSNEKKSFGTEELTTTSRFNGLPKKRQSRPFRRNLSLNSRKLVIPNENLVPPHLISQLGMNPHGIRPSGVNPFGMQPQGITPFGISPKGIDPLGLRRQMLNVTNNSTLVNPPTTNVTNETNTELKPDPLAEERVHVQVTKPDGSINGDYLVLDHNTGSLSGVRYEAIDGADQALIQKALLSFLSLDPRLDPRPKDINGENLPEISELADAVQPSSDPSTNTELTISVKLKPQITDQT